MTKKLKPKGKKRLHVDKQALSVWIPSQAYIVNLWEETQSITGGISHGPSFSGCCLQILSKESGRSNELVSKALANNLQILHIHTAVKNINQLDSLFRSLPNGSPFKIITGGKLRKQQVPNKWFYEWVSKMNECVIDWMKSLHTPESKSVNDRSHFSSQWLHGLLKLEISSWEESWESLFILISNQKTQPWWYQ